MDKMCITVPEMADQLGLGRATAYNLARSQDFYPAFRIGKKVLVNVEALRRWVNEQKKQEE